MELSRRAGGATPAAADAAGSRWRIVTLAGGAARATVGRFRSTVRCSTVRRDRINLSGTMPDDRYFDDFRAGDRFESAGLTITESAIIDFALQWDPQPFHIDAEYARAAGDFGGLIASGLHTISASHRLWFADRIFGACTIASPGFDAVQFLKPVRPGDTLRVVTELLELRPSESKPDRGAVKMRHTTFNQRGEEVLTIDARVILRRRAA
jgi:acyl dehydratase